MTEEQKIQRVIEVIEQHDFAVHNDPECYDDNYWEMETWTDGGVDMIECIDCRDYPDGITAENIIDQINQISANFDVDEEIRIHREGADYCRAFTCRQSVEDFEAYQKRLQYLAIALNHDDLLNDEQEDESDMHKEYGNQPVHEVTIRKRYSDDDISNIVCTALEGGIGYWARLDNTDEEIWFADDRATSEIATDLLLSGQWIKFEDAEDEDDSTDWLLNLDKLLRGIAMAIENGDWDGDLDTIDATAADCVFQYALFNEVVYG